MQPRSGILLRQGKRLRIQELPFQMLLALLESPGELVTKEALGVRLWGQETFIEVDKSLYVVAAKLRDVLGDQASRPRFVKTVSGRGYRFVGEVTPVFAAADAGLRQVVPPPIPQLVLPAVPSAPLRPAVRRRVFAVCALLVLLAGLGALAYRLLSPHRPLINSHDLVVVGGFSNQTGKPELDKILSSAALLKLEESPYLSIVPDRRFTSLVADPEHEPLGRQLQACATLHARVLLNGQILNAASGYRIQMAAWRCPDGRRLTTVHADTESQSAILAALDSVVDGIRWQMGESSESLGRFNVPLMQATTSSLSALRAFTIGEDKRIHGQEAESISYYKLAVDLDPQFALAYARLGTLYYNIGEFSLSEQNDRRAFELRGRTTDRERLYIMSHYYSDVTGEIPRAVEVFDLWRSMYPRDMAPVNNLAIAWLLVGQPEKTLPLARVAVQMDPVSNQPYSTLVQSYLMTGDFSDLNPACRHPPGGRSDGIVFHESCFFAAFAQNDAPGMQREVQWAQGKPQESSIVRDEALVAIDRGRVSDARQLFSSAVRLEFQRQQLDGAADADLDAAIAQAETGFPAEARENALAALKIAPRSLIVQSLAAFVLARSGDVAAAERQIAAVNAQHPLNMLVNQALLSTTQAAIQMQKHEPEAAIQSLAPARPWDFNYFLQFASAYLRGEACLRSGQPNEAAAEFRRVLDHRMAGAASVYVTLSELELGRALQLAGDAGSARQAFANAAANWKDADPDFPPLRQLIAYQHLPAHPDRQ